MAEHFKYYPSDEAVVTPWNARYSYPSQANKAVKMTPRIPPKNGTSFTPGQIIRLEFPAQGYVNPTNTHLEFDVVLYGPIVSSGAFAARFQNNIQSIFNRVRLLYGGTPVEDVLQYGVIVRCLTEWTTGSQLTSIDRSSITDGIGGTVTNTGLVGTGASLGTLSSVAVAGTYQLTFTGTSLPVYAAGTFVSISGITGQTTGSYNGIFQLTTASTATTMTVYNYTGVTGTAVMGSAVLQTTINTINNVNSRQAAIQGIQGATSVASSVGLGTVPNSLISGNIPSGCPSALTGQAFSVRRYMVNFLLGMFTQDKLIPTKYMASQLAIEITLETSAACIYQPLGFATTTTYPSYAVGNINLIPEIIEFDDTYDEMFLSGLENGGVPIKFSTWHYFQFGTQNSSALQLQITERSRSVKGIFSVQRRAPAGFQYDSHACFYDTFQTQGIISGSTLQSYQYRIGGRYFPAAPIQNSTTVGGSTSNGGAESFVELEKFLNIVGNYTIESNVTPYNWAVPSLTNYVTGTSVALLPEYDYSYCVLGFTPFGQPQVAFIESLAIAGSSPSSMYACAINFETSNGIEISGLNAEEQSDISFLVNWSNSQATGFTLECFTYVDVMMVLRPNNYVDLIQ